VAQLGPVAGRRSDGPLPPGALGPSKVGSPSSDRTFLDYDYDLDDEPVFSSPPRTQSRSRPPPPPRGPGPLNALLQSDCRSKTRTLPHEKYCDLYYHATGCDDGQRLLRSCPNGLLYTGGGRPGLIGVCDYPHNVDCTLREEKHSE